MIAGWLIVDFLQLTPLHAAHFIRLLIPGLSQPFPKRPYQKHAPMYGTHPDVLVSGQRAKNISYYLLCPTESNPTNRELRVICPLALKAQRWAGGWSSGEGFDDGEAILLPNAHLALGVVEGQ